MDQGEHALAAVSEPRRPIYYGWWVLAAAAVTEMLVIGSISYASGLFVVPLEQELSLSRAAASSALPIAFAGGAVMAPIVGYLLDRISISWVLVIGVLSLCLGFLTIAATSSLAGMAAALFVLVGFGGMAVGPLTSSTLASRWFYLRRGRALGIAAVATSGGGIVVVPLLSLAIEAYGWRTALAMEALLITLIVVGLALWVIRSSPDDAEAKTHPENRGRPASDLALASSPLLKAGAGSYRYREILTSVNFWSIGFALAAITGINQALVVTLVPYATGLGLSAPLSALLISTLAVSAAITKVASGFLAEFVERRMIMLASAAAMIAALIVLLASASYPMLLVACVLAGTALGCVIPSAAALVAGCFGAASFGRVMGAIYVAVVTASVISVRFAGATFDSAGEYSGVFLTFLVVTVIAAGAALMVRTPQDQIQTQL